MPTVDRDQTSEPREPRRITARPSSQKNKLAPEPTSLRGGRPSKKDVELLELRILSEATRLFAANGFAATSMEQIVSACGVGKDTIYRRYSNKADLFQVVIDHLREHAIKRLDAATPVGGAPLEKLSSFARQLLSINLDPQLLALHRISYSELIAFGHPPKLATADDPIMQRFAALVLEAQHAGDLAPGDAVFIADQLLYAVAVKPTLAAMLDRNAFGNEEERDAYFDRAWRLFMQGARCWKLEERPFYSGGRSKPD